MKSFWILAALVFLVWPSSAVANWQYTQWGMSLDQVQAASGGKLASPLDHSACSGTCLSGDYSADGFQFKATFRFDSRGELSEVELQTPSTNRGWGCNTLFDSLSARYGTPVWQSPPSGMMREMLGHLPTTRWLDPQGGNTVFFIDAAILMGNCSIEYSPIASSKGL